MNTPATTLTTTRRDFIKTSLAAAAAFTLPRFAIGAPGVKPNSKLNVVCIGAGNRGWFAVNEMLTNPNVNLVAICDVDQELLKKSYEKAAKLLAEGHTTIDLKKVPLYKDYREMFAKIGDKFDAVTVSTPDHHHYPAGMLALKNGKHLWIEKPLTRVIGEARALLEESRKRGVITQMGNQGRTTNGIRQMREWTKAGVIGEVREVHAWSPDFSAQYFKRPDSLPLPAEKPPAALAWDLWLGPAKKRPFNSRYVRELWRGWWDFGCGMLGDWGAHTLDAPWWSLDLGAPETVEADVSEVSHAVSPKWAIVTYKFPARGNLPPVTLKWFEGKDKLPPLPEWWDKDEKFPDRGMLMFGDKNTIYAPGGRPDNPRLAPKDAWEKFRKNQPAATIPRVKGGPVVEWINAICNDGPKPGSTFDYSVPLTEVILLGALAQRTGKKIQWDAKAGKVVNDPALNRFVEIQARDGWRV